MRWGYSYKTRRAYKAGSVLVMTSFARLTHAFHSAKVAAAIPSMGGNYWIVELRLGLKVSLSCRRLSSSSGKRLAEIIELARNFMLRVYLIAFIDPLYYLTFCKEIHLMVLLAPEYLSINLITITIR